MKYPRKILPHRWKNQQSGPSGVRAPTTVKDAMVTAKRIGKAILTGCFLSGSRILLRGL